MHIQIISSVPAYLLSVRGSAPATKRLAITPLVDGVPGATYSATTHPVSGSPDVNVSLFDAAVAESERATFGFYPVTPAVTFDSDQYSSSGKTYTFDSPNGIEAHTLVGRNIADVKAQAIAAIDGAAGTARGRYVSVGAMVTDEYRLALAEAKAYAAAGYTGEIPLSITAWVNGSAFTATDAADNIIATEAQLNAVLNSIRTIRLPAKKAVNDAGTAADVITARDNAVTLLDAV